NEWEAGRRRLFRNPLEEEQMLLMRHPMTTERAFALFGLLLGTLPPAAIFIKLFGGVLAQSLFSLGWLLLLSMNAICCLAGRYFGLKLSRMVRAVERDSWILMLIESLA